MLHNFLIFITVTVIKNQRSCAAAFASSYGISSGTEEGCWGPNDVDTAVVLAAAGGTPTAQVYIVNYSYVLV